MAENSKLESIDSENLSSTCELQEKENTSIKSDSFIVDMERFSHLTDKDVTANSRIARSLSRKGSQRSRDKKINSSLCSEGDLNNAISTSPRAALAGTSTPEKPMVVTVGASDHPASPHVHHQITVVTGNIEATSTSTSTSTATVIQSKCGGRRFSFRRSSPPGAIDPRRILFFFATLSSMGTMLLIYFTLSMGKLSTEDDNALNW